MSLFAFEMTGLDEVQARMQRARQALADEAALKKIMVEAATPILERIRAALPKKTGLTAADLAINVDVPGAVGVVQIEIGAHRGKRGRAYILRFIEFGRSGVPARPIIRATWDAEQEAYVGRVVSGVRRLMNV